MCKKRHHVLVMFLAALVQAGAAQVASPSKTAMAFMKRGLCNEAASLLLREISGRPEPESAVRFLMLGECYYRLNRYNDARPRFLQALKYLPDGPNKALAEYRMACIGYRVKDKEGAETLTAKFIRDYPNDERGGKLLVYKMQALASRGRPALGELEKASAEIKARKHVYGSAVALAADKVLTDFYLDHDMEDKATEGYMRIVRSYNSAAAEYMSQGRAMPTSLERSRDYAAMQLAQVSIRRNQPSEAMKWLNSITFDPHMRRQARLMLAQIAYRQRDYRKAESYLLDNGFIYDVPKGRTLSDMYLLLGFCAKHKPQPTMEEVVGYFNRVAPDSPAYAQAQMGIGDTCEKWRRHDLAVAAYEKALDSKKYEPRALSRLGPLYIELAREAEAGEDAERKGALLDKAAEYLNRLAKSYPGSAYVSEVEPSIELLIKEGRVVESAVSERYMAREWERRVAENPGTAEAVRSLVSLIRHHQKAVTADESKRFIKAPDYAACYTCCTQLLDNAVYKGQDLSRDQWNDTRAEALYYRALCHVASLGAKPAATSDDPQPVFLDAPDARVALDDLKQARDLAGAKQLDLKKNIAFLETEAMLKSDDDGLRKQAEARFAELRERYGQDPRLTRMTMEIAQWHHEQGHHVTAADLYREISRTAANTLPQEDLLRVVFMAGKLYSRAALDAMRAKTDQRHMIYVYPREVVKLDGFISSHGPFLKPVRVDWSAPELSARQALQELSEASGIPFVWDQAAGSPVQDYLRNTNVRIKARTGTVADFLRQILDLQTQSLGEDIGLAKGKPTIAPPPPDDADPDGEANGTVVEIYRTADAVTRYRPMRRSYGVWQSVHPRGAMMFNIIKRIEELTDTTVQWAEGMSVEDVLAREFGAVPGHPRTANLPVADVLGSLSDALSLSFRIEPRDLATELFDKAKDCFNDVQRASPRSAYGEQSLFLLALNYYYRRQYERMKIVLQQYLKIFDSPSFDHYHEACFWVGWVLERERRYGEAVRYYTLASEEQLHVYLPGTNAPPPDCAAVLEAVSHETRFALEELATVKLQPFTLGDRTLPEFLRIYAGMEMALDPSTTPVATNLVAVSSFTQTRVIDILCGCLKPLGVALRPVNVDARAAEMAYYRLAVCYQNEGFDQGALTSCRCLLERYPETRRRRDVFKLQLGIFKRLKDYRSVLATLEQLKAELLAEGKAYQIDYELGWIYFDLCRYDKAADHFRDAMRGARGPGERLRIRDGYARTLFRLGLREEALQQYESLLGQEHEPLRAFVNELMIWFLRRATGKEASDELPPEPSKMLRLFDAMTEEQQAQLDTAAYTKVTWIYYTTALVDLMRGDLDRALPKLNAAGNSPDDWLAAEALYQAAMLHLNGDRLDAAKEALEYLLFTTKSAEAEVKALYALALCHRRRGEATEADLRLQQLQKRFPDSAYAMKLREPDREAPADTNAAPAAAGAPGPAPDGTQAATNTTVKTAAP